MLLPGARTWTPAGGRNASRDRWGALLKHGVRIYEFEPTMYHCKTMIVDDFWTSVGSANFDNRSFRLNDEANLNVIDNEIAAGETRAFEKPTSRKPGKSPTRTGQRHSPGSG